VEASPWGLTPRKVRPLQSHIVSRSPNNNQVYQAWRSTCGGHLQVYSYTLAGPNPYGNAGGLFIQE
jgi:hypothetical protein